MLRWCGATLLATAALLGPATAAAAAAPSTASTPSTPEAQLLVLKAEAREFGALQDALEARLPAAAVFAYTSSALDVLEGRRFLFIEVEPRSSKEVVTRIILQDGRLFERSIAVDGETRARAIATTLANTIAAIEEERLEPTRRDATVPPPPSSAPVDLPTPAPELPPEPPAQVDPEPSFELGIDASGGLLSGFGSGRPGMGSAALGLSLRLPNALVIGLGSRVATVALDGTRVTRVAPSVGVGYLARTKNFELLMLGMFVAEPWWVTGPSRPQTLEDSAGNGASPLLGGGISLAPGYFFRPLGRPGLGIRAGLRADILGSQMASGGQAELRVVDEQGNTKAVARLGGLELCFGANIGFWFALEPH